ncbi:MAG: YidC/Oxa1 family membrane protein insertase [Lachnospiraceae bacterium]|nr:YidC/Oxa1 family membrane protein insertase [Lachnospiraceae bacterium]
MTFGSMLSTLIIGPLKFVFEIIFQLVYELVGDPGISIIALSLVMNVLVLPLYRRADAVQEQARDREAALAPGVKHIKKTFSGNEGMMMLQTYYRQNHYSPLNAFTGSVSLLLEIPFFMAAYQFLSHLPLLTGSSFWMIRNLGVPDGLLSAGSLKINVLPVVMTLVNFASAAIYLKGFPLKTKIRTYVIAVVFLVLLYDSPAGLVFYWTLNNVFSLFKNLILLVLLPKLKARKERRASQGKDALKAEKKKSRKQKKEKKEKQKRPLPAPEPGLFLAPAVFLSVLIGFFIPSVYISASPLEYVDPARYFDPVWYNVSAALLSFGTFLLWAGVFYWLASAKGKVIIERVMLISAVLGAVNYMFFGTHLGFLSAALQYEGGLAFFEEERILNGVVFAGIVALTLIFAKKLKKIPHYVLFAGTAALLIMTVMNTAGTRRALREMKPPEEEQKPQLSFSEDGQNVAVLFLDRAMAEYMPYMLKEKPDLRRMFDGFTWYRNTVSFGGHTNMGAPALMGGYEYTPVEMNRRDAELLVDKHNESAKVLPVLFSQNDFGVTVCDVPYANYKWIPDLSIFDEYPEIRKYITKGAFGNQTDEEASSQSNLRNFFAFSWMKTLPLELQQIVYDSGNYLVAGGEFGAVAQISYGISKARGIDRTFLLPFDVLTHLNDMTKTEAGSKGQYLFFYNDAPHEPTLLTEPEYLPAVAIDNTDYDEKHEDRFTSDGKTLIVENRQQMIHYQSNMAVLLQVGKWFDHLRMLGVYDNTRIIIVSDHGYYLGQDPERLFKAGNKEVDTEAFYPLLMVKDFNAAGFSISDEFMTNADVPALAVKDLIRDPKNPFTGKTISSDEKTAHDQFIMTSRDWHVNRTDKTFDASGWAVVGKDMNSRENWRFIEKETVLKEHRMPEK